MSFDHIDDAKIKEVFYYIHAINQIAEERHVYGVDPLEVLKVITNRELVDAVAGIEVAIDDLRGTIPSET